MSKEIITTISKGLVGVLLIFVSCWPFINQKAIAFLFFPLGIYFAYNAFINKKYFLGAFYLLSALLYNPIQISNLPKDIYILANFLVSMLVFSDILRWYFLDIVVAILYNSGEYNKAEKVAKLAIGAAKETFGLKSKNLETSQNDSNDINKALGNSVEEKLVIVENDLSSLNVLFEEDKDINDFVNKNSLVQKSLTTKSFSPVSRKCMQFVARKMINLALFYSNNNKFNEADSLMRLAMSLWDETEGMHELANVYDMLSSRKQEHLEDLQTKEEISYKVTVEDAHEVVKNNNSDNSGEDDEEFLWPPKQKKPPNKDSIDLTR